MKGKKRAGDVDQFLELLPSTCEALGSTPPLSFLSQTEDFVVVFKTEGL